MPLVLRIHAGRSVRREGTYYVDPLYEPGYLELEQITHDLLELKWVHRNTGEIEERLMLVPGDSTFREVFYDDTGRTYVLDFKGSPEKFFYWLQRDVIEDELRNVADLNGYLRVPNYLKGQDTIAKRLIRPFHDKERWGTSFVEADTAKLAVLWARKGILTDSDEDGTLRAQLINRRVAFRLAFQPSLIDPLRALLPHDYRFPTRHTPENVLPIIQAPQFLDAISCLEAALNERQFPATLMVEMGLEPDDGRDLDSFILALTRTRACVETGPERTEPDPINNYRRNIVRRPSDPRPPRR